MRTIHDNIQLKLNEAFEGAKDYQPKAKDWLASHWQGFMSPAQLSRIRNTGEAPSRPCQVRARGSLMCGGLASRTQLQARRTTSHAQSHNNPASPFAPFHPPGVKMDVLQAVGPPPITPPHTRTHPHTAHTDPHNPAPLHTTTLQA